MTRPDIFICFSSKDLKVAREVAQFLEARRLKCWLSSRDVGGGENYQEAIVDQIQASKVLIFLFSENSNRSGEVRKELSLAGSMGAAVIPLRLDDITPAGGLRYELATRQWIDAFEDREAAFGRLSQAVRQALTTVPSRRGASEPAPRTHSAKAPAAQAAPAMSEAVLPPQPAHAPLVVSGTEQFEAVRTLLARHIGPIAKICIQKAASEAQSVDDLCERLAAQVRDPADRSAFLKAARVRLAAG
jgi:hypothetical protein